VLPALCRNCGASARFVHDELHCGYCGLHEPMPRDQGALIGVLQQRLFFAANESFQVTGTLRLLIGVFEQGPRVGAIAWSLFALSAAVMGSVAADSWATWQAAPVAARASLVSSALFTPALVLAVPISIVVARLVGRQRYRRILRPHLLARAPRLGAKAARCRVCGGDLPQSLERFVVCKFCRIESVVGPELFQQHNPAARPSQHPELAPRQSVPPAARGPASWMKLAMGLSFAGSLVTAACVLWLVYRTLAVSSR
jgi:hypothetical protein